MLRGCGIAARTDLLDALAIEGRISSAAVGPEASFPVLALDERELLFQALVTMTEHHIHRVVVTRACPGGVPLLGRHTALGDAVTTALCWLALLVPEVGLEPTRF